ncbi:hypothetical protein GGS23DRAFT_593462 [Durotheca rogersii]|uniref:uncharacterized protein n=1 Tax=Durotheca rogersii TaxID=419775 RepID=UPI00221FEC5A|nr:uncharacterized protein GGS23DRAFT_593462 [Durotheca rogersii]KAI5866724.1 hypothetical protein GGS23DRAFT_593462 [Durotheca rogersii]
MCTGICWLYVCRGCGTGLLKDPHVAGHTCRMARQNGRRGRCRTGIEYRGPIATAATTTGAGAAKPAGGGESFYRKVANELCVLCELGPEIVMLDATTCAEAEREGRLFGGAGWDSGHASAGLGEGEGSGSESPCPTDCECCDGDDEGEEEQTETDGEDASTAEDKDDDDDDDDDEEGGALLSNGDREDGGATRDAAKRSTRYVMAPSRIW